MKFSSQRIVHGFQIRFVLELVRAGCCSVYFDHELNEVCELLANRIREPNSKFPNPLISIELFHLQLTEGSIALLTWWQMFQKRHASSLGVPYGAGKFPCLL